MYIYIYMHIYRIPPHRRALSGYVNSVNSFSGSISCINSGKVPSMV
jgi:hypothetical protein